MKSNVTTANQGCKVGKKYPKTGCAPGTVCYPVMGSFVDHCERKNCNNFN